MSEQTTLLINTATVVGVVGVARGDKILAERCLELSASSNTVVQAIDESCAEAQCSTRDLTRVLLVKGPGTFTGSRVGASIAKAIAYALARPLLSVTTLQAVAARSVLQGHDGHVWAVLDARRHEFYVQEFLAHGTEIQPQGPAACLTASFFDSAREQEGTVACAFPMASLPAESHPRQEDRIAWLFNCHPDCSAILALASQSQREDPFVLEPLYLRSTEDLFGAARVS